jgi:hypothetical protein
MFTFLEFIQYVRIVFRLLRYIESLKDSNKFTGIMPEAIPGK